MSDSIIKRTPKEEKNIRRRVYDALNVLLAAKVVDQKGKMIICGK